MVQWLQIEINNTRLAYISVCTDRDLKSISAKKNYETKIFARCLDLYTEMHQNDKLMYRSGQRAMHYQCDVDTSREMRECQGIDVNIETITHTGRYDIYDNEDKNRDNNIKETKHL